MIAMRQGGGPVVGCSLSFHLSLGLTFAVCLFAPDNWRSPQIFRCKTNCRRGTVFREEKLIAHVAVSGQRYKFNLTLVNNRMAIV